MNDVEWSLSGREAKLRKLATCNKKRCHGIQQTEVHELLHESSAGRYTYEEHMVVSRCCWLSPLVVDFLSLLMLLLCGVYEATTVLFTVPSKIGKRWVTLYICQAENLRNKKQKDLGTTNHPRVRFSGSRCFVEEEYSRKIPDIIVWALLVLVIQPLCSYGSTFLHFRMGTGGGRPIVLCGNGQP